MTIGDMLREYRSVHGMTMRDLAARFGVSVMAVSKWEGGKSAPEKFRFPQLAQMLGCTTDDLYKLEWRNGLAPADTSIVPQEGGKGHAG